MFVICLLFISASIDDLASGNADLFWLVMSRMSRMSCTARVYRSNTKKFAYLFTYYLLFYIFFENPRHVTLDPRLSTLDPRPKPKLLKSYSVFLVVVYLFFIFIFIIIIIIIIIICLGGGGGGVVVLFLLLLL